MIYTLTILVSDVVFLNGIKYGFIVVLFIGYEDWFKAVTEYGTVMRLLLGSEDGIKYGFLILILLGSDVVLEDGFEYGILLGLLLGFKYGIGYGNVLELLLVYDVEFEDGIKYGSILGIFLINGVGLEDVLKDVILYELLL